MKSLRVKLSVLLLLAAIVAALAVGVVTYRQALKENEELFDYQLRQIALSLRDQGVAAVPSFRFDEEPPNVVVQIWTDDGTMLYLSHAGDPLFRRARLGFTNIDAGNQLWRVYAISTRGRVIQVAQPFNLRRDLAAHAAWRSLAPLLGFAPLMALMIWWLVGSSLSPLRRLARDVGKRDAGSLEKVSEAGMPSEIAPVVRALNSLLERLQRAFASQRAFVADAAHELRSPMTALKLQLQLLARAPDDEARKEALDNLHRGIDRATHLIEQLLMAAQTDPNDRIPERQSIDLAELVRGAIADLFVFAQARQIDIALEAPDRLVFEADSSGLRILARNLLDNAIRYTPAGGKVQAQVGQRAGEVVLTVEDSGPGIPADDRRRVFDRFYRRNHGEQSGSGLGLSIVHNIAEQHGARIELGESPLGGLKVTISFGKPGPMKAKTL